jgi:hypothetical protein
MKKKECETAIRALSHQWREARGLPPPDGTTQYSFSDFKTWLQEKHCSSYLDFRSVRGADGDAEDWFDREMKQAWRN